MKIPYGLKTLAKKHKGKVHDGLITNINVVFDGTSRARMFYVEASNRYRKKWKITEHGSFVKFVPK